MKRFIRLLYIILSLVFLAYLAIPSPEFPAPPPDALQSNEPGDVQDPLEPAYFTNYDRQEILNHYEEQLSEISFYGTKIPVPTYRLNYPPEESQTIIRDQLRSVFLEEIVHPFRESLYVSGFKAESEKDTIFIEDKVWQHKITLRYVPSAAYQRVAIGLITVILLVITTIEWKNAFVDLRKVLKKVKL